MGTLCTKEQAIDDPISLGYENFAKIEDWGRCKGGAKIVPDRKAMVYYQIKDRFRSSYKAASEGWQHAFPMMARDVFGHPRNHVAFIEPAVLTHLLPFLYEKSLYRAATVCPHWFAAIVKALGDIASDLDLEVRKAVFPFLDVRRARTDWNVIHTADVGVRYDRIYWGEVTPVAQNQTVEISYSFCYVEGAEAGNSTSASTADGTSTVYNFYKGGRCGDAATDAPSSSAAAAASERETGSAWGAGQMAEDRGRKRYSASYKFSVLPKGSKRRIWAERDICRHHGDEARIATTPWIMPVCVGDVVEFGVQLANLVGAVDLDSVRMEKVNISKFRLDECFYETDWTIGRKWENRALFEAQTVERVDDHPPEHFAPHLRHVWTLYSGGDIVVSKSLHVAEKNGAVPNSVRHLGVVWEVYNPDASVVVPLKRSLIYHDRQASIQLRQGDELLFYVMKGGKMA
uniref:Uncharacterized protein n=1 Tax=Chromera velia CCMP2878 TaxID=1169474 RepID=A0A0G4F1Z4_9ALVE|mmetsp:Transcript_17694/g.35928  ORF Transcript_17694/g.35928 Transcript_17694/m.35928 type:complete len:458 (-) Transcript_17694:663-2036(-)|eukprot:Cvel_14590.t1-p1 / transcript=Cvel_14590.t1 / gene=Cvel_14590 / organism=Chromera_velia_CCMP2878 / gene_product=hypothetical protein / transcript_product=hypothetical protein / location=Cvel_scaffold1043:27729-31935(+) / protein_length=457 / sequence_SO=supercontig / SO=protein_coding / is_pseudo=false